MLIVTLKSIFPGTQFKIGRRCTMGTRVCNRHSSSGDYDPPNQATVYNERRLRLVFLLHRRGPTVKNCAFGGASLEKIRR